MSTFWMKTIFISCITNGVLISIWSSISEFTLSDVCRTCIRWVWLLQLSRFRSGYSIACLWSTCTFEWDERRTRTQILISLLKLCISFELSEHRMPSLINCSFDALTCFLVRCEKHECLLKNTYEYEYDRRSGEISDCCDTIVARASGDCGLAAATANKIAKMIANFMFLGDGFDLDTRTAQMFLIHKIIEYNQFIMKPKWRFDNCLPSLQLIFFLI